MAETKTKNIATTETQVSGDTLSFIASKEVIDRDGDIIFVDGIDTKEFEKNPVFLWGHDLSSLPIGKVTSIQKRTDSNGVKELAISVEFHNSEKAQEIKGMYVNGFLNGVSVRILPTKYDSYKSEAGKGLKFIESKLLEVSAVTVPANQEALIQKALEQALEIKRMNKQIGELKEVYSRLETLTETLAKYFAGRETISKGNESRINDIAKKLQGEKK